MLDPGPEYQLTLDVHGGIHPTMAYFGAQVSKCPQNQLTFQRTDQERSGPRRKVTEDMSKGGTISHKKALNTKAGTQTGANA